MANTLKAGEVASEDLFLVYDGGFDADHLKEHDGMPPGARGFALVLKGDLVTEAMVREQARVRSIGKADDAAAADKSPLAVLAAAGDAAARSALGEAPVPSRPAAGRAPRA